MLQDEIAAIARIDAVPRILDVICRTTGMGFAAVARVTEDRWIACSVLDKIDFGLRPGSELEVGTTICDAIRELGQPVAIDHVERDPVYCNHPTPLMYGFQSYISMPIFLRHGGFFGTLCAIDPQPHRVNTPEILEMFQLFVELIAFHLDGELAIEASGRALREERARQSEVRERFADSERALLDERQNAELREQFIAVLGHDLRNPLSSLSAGIEFLSQAPQHPRAPAMMAIMKKSVERMKGLIDNLLDLAQARQAGGLAIQRNTDREIARDLEHVIEELRTAWPQRQIDAEVSVTKPVSCDRVRVAQLLSNLLANAITHGAPDQPIVVKVDDSRSVFEVSVTNGGAPIPHDALKHLFQPFFRASMRNSQQGLGLGLYIASEIARAHGGTLDVASSAEFTRFTFRMPLG